MGFADEWTAKLLAFIVGRLKKVCRSALAVVEPVGLGSTQTRFESFSKLDR